MGRAELLTVPHRVPHRRKWGFHAGPEPDLAASLMDEHPEPAPDRGAGVLGFNQKGRHGGLVDEIDDELARPEPSRIDTRDHHIAAHRSHRWSTAVGALWVTLPPLMASCGIA